MSLKLFTLTLAAIASASPFEPLTKASSDIPCEPCKPQGATALTPPSVGSDLAPLYSEVLESIKDIRAPAAKRSFHGRAEEGFCCRQSLDCVNVQNLNIPMCYDKFTTNFAFADGSYGSITTGEYHSGSSDAKANLISGDFSASGQDGNIYADQPDAKPNTATMSIPAQFTGTGVGAALAPTELGSIIVYTTTIPGTTYSAPTTVAETVEVATVSGLEVSTTVPATTITQATTVAPRTEVVTQTNTAAVASGTAESTSAESTGAAGQVSVDSTKSIGMSVLGALMYALYAL
jgi:hypothetical protein